MPGVCRGREFSLNHGIRMVVISSLKLSASNSVTAKLNVSKLPSFMGAGKVDEDGTFNVWVDPKTNLPTRIKLRMRLGPQNSPVELDFDNFRWNPEFPPGHFDMVVPEGYQLMPAQAASSP